MDFGRIEGLRPSIVEAVRVCFGPAAAVTRVVDLPAQASTRSYHRIELSGGSAPSSAVVMRLPENPFASDEAAGSDAVQELPFCNVQRFLDARGIPVPTLYLDAARQGFLLLEDLGDRTLLSEVRGTDPRRLRERYEEAVDLLARFQEATRGVACPECVGYGRTFDHGLLRWELDHFKEWLLLEFAGARLSQEEDAVVESAFDDIATRLSSAPYILGHRDFQSTNLMRHGSRLVLIDFQDALMAPATYDLVALLRDSYVVIPPEEVLGLQRLYFDRARDVLPVAGFDELLALFNLQALQRKLKDSGRFVFIDRKRGNPSFLRFIPDSLGYVAQALLALPEYSALGAVLARHVRGLAA